MPSFDDARILILENVAPLGIERVPVLESLGRVLAEDVIAPGDMPPYDNSAMDGFAVRASECATSARLPIAGYMPAGAEPGMILAPGSAIRIMTGAPIPEGCDAVIPFEDAEECDGTVRPTCRVHLHQHMRFTGEDVRQGEIVCPKGTVVRPAEISMIAGFGRVFVAVYRQPRVAIVSTGDELLEAGEPMLPGKIINSNAPALAAAIRDAGAIPVIVGIARDTHESHREKLLCGLAADVLVTSAGVSAGDRDLVRGVLDELGVRQVFHRVDIKPGGPTAFAVKDDKPVFCLPGNPVAALLTFEAFVRPALLKMMGHTRVFKRPLKAVLHDAAQKKQGKIKLLRVRLEISEGKIVAYSSGDQNTGMLKTMVNADGIAILPAERTSFSPGDEVEVLALSTHLEMLEPQEIR